MADSKKAKKASAKTNVKAAPSDTNVVSTEVVLTKEGYDNLVKELEDRRENKREEIANKLEVATEQGDLSENSAYKSALEEKELNEAKIEELERILANAKIGDNSSPASVAGLGDKIILESVIDNKESIYTLVGRSETDPAKGFISIESPVGKAVYGQRLGSTIEVKLPLKKVVYKLVKIN